MVRPLLLRYYRRHLHQNAKHSAYGFVPQRSALVFAPHQDDETLGCGGTIIKKRQAGAEVKIVFMGDGSSSHSHLIAPDELSTIRTQEAIAACRVLGLGEEDILFLNFPESRFRAEYETVCTQVAALIERYQPGEVYIPYAQDVNEDHLVTNQAVRQALQMYPGQMIVYEYPVWAWFHWPWVGLFSGIRRPSRRVITYTFYTCFGIRLLRDLNCGLYMGDVLPQKRTALDQHQSQMIRLKPNTDWLTLHDVANGAWLACFFQEYELFQGYQFCGDCSSSHAPR